MTLFIDDHQDCITQDFQAFFETVIEETLKVLHLEIQVEVSLLLVDNEEIRGLNNQFRGKDKATDVLSFPMLELDPSDQCNNHTLMAAAQYHPQDEELLLGDIVISVEMAQAQAVEYGHGIQRELGFLMVHGLLHLLGYDHEKGAAEENTMRMLQQEILHDMQLSREEDITDH